MSFRETTRDFMKLGLAFGRATVAAYKLRQVQAREAPPAFLMPPHGEPCKAARSGLRVIGLHVHRYGLPDSDQLVIDPDDNLLLTSIDHLPYVCHTPELVAPRRDERPSIAQLVIDRSVAWSKDLVFSYTDMTSQAHRLWLASITQVTDPQATPSAHQRLRLIEVRDQLATALRKAWTDTQAQPTPSNELDAMCYLESDTHRIYSVRSSDRAFVRSHLWLDHLGRVSARGVKRPGQPGIVQIGRAVFNLNALHVPDYDQTPQDLIAIERSKHAPTESIDKLNGATLYGEEKGNDHTFGAGYLRIAWADDKGLLAAGWVNPRLGTGEISLCPNPEQRNDTSDPSGDQLDWKVLKGREAVTLWTARSCTATRIDYRDVSRKS